jgi:phenylpropionate dioxygenase-like ring-hydroxylating dioxygenase large terminal subunit
MVGIFAEHFRERWFVIARSAKVGATPISAFAFGRPFALVRDPALGVLAYEDRCPHRGAPLSLGRLSPQGLTCPYHGWTFDPAGRCRSITGACSPQPNIDIRVPVFPVRERDGLIWVSAKDSNPLPLRALELDPAGRRYVGQFRWRAPILEAQENFLDALHTPFIHPGIVRNDSERTAVKVVLQRTGDGFVVDYSGQARQSGWLYRLFESPRESERAYFSGLSMAQLEYRYQTSWALWISLYFTPETAASTHVFATLHVAGRFAPTWLMRLLVWPLLRRVGRQDQFILEQQELNRCHFPERRHVITELDVARPYLEAAWNGREGEMPARRESTLML